MSSDHNARNGHPFPPRHEDVLGSRHETPRILGLGTRWKKSPSHTNIFVSAENDPCDHLQGTGCIMGSSGRSGKDRNFICRESNSDRTCHSSVTVVVGISRQFYRYGIALAIHWPHILFYETWQGNPVSDIACCRRWLVQRSNSDISSSCAVGINKSECLVMMMWFGARSLGASVFPVPVCGTFHSSARSVAYH